VIGGESLKVSEMIERLKIRNASGMDIPLNSLVRLHREYDLKTITAGRDGEYVPVNFNTTDKEYLSIAASVKEVVKQHPEAEVRFFGSIFENRQMLREMMLVLFISVLIMYFILAAQFESLLQPIILLVELPVEIGLMFFVLWITDNTLNLISAIGIIVVCSIVINDSILKIDTINRLRLQGMNIDEAIHNAGSRRLKAIILTSLTTILTVAPLLFTSDMGSELQRPFAWTIITGMTFGPIVSLFLIPLIYRAMYKKRFNDSR
jgi:multidrug efflux pump subunit AcrB